MYSGFMHLKQKLKRISDYDILAHLVAGYRAIPDLYKTTFWLIFIALNIVFAYHTVHFIMGNHEWPFMREAMAWNRFWYEGRITEAFPHALFGFQLLPIALNLFDFIGISLSVVAVAHFLKVPHTKFCFIGFCLPMAMLPYNLCYLFHNAQGVFFYGAFLIVMALMWIEKIYQKHQSFLNYIFPIFILFFVLGFHAAFIESMLILLVAHVLIRYFSGEKFKPLFKEMCVAGVNVFMAALVLKGSLILIEKRGYLSSHFYNVQTVKWENIASHLIEVCRYVFQQFTITYPFLERPYLSLLWGICIVSGLLMLCGAYRKRGLKGVLVGIVGIGSLLFLTQLATLISDNANQLQFMTRLNGYFGLQFMLFAFWAFLFQSSQKIFLKNILFLVVVVLSGMSIHRDMYAMRVWKQGLDAENKVMDHVMIRIENNPHFNYSKRYRLAQVGDLSLRKRYYQGEYKNEDVSLLGWSYRANWLNFHFYNFYALDDFILQDLTNQWQSIFQLCTPNDFDFIINKARVWPDQNSVYISHNLIMIFLDQWELQNLRNQLKAYLEKNNIPIQDKIQTIPFNEQLKHPDWGPDNLIRIDDERIYHPRFNNYATLLEYTADHILLDWDCCGHQLFIKNADGIYEYQQ